MPSYYYIAKTKEGKSVKGIEDASSREDLISRLKNKELFIISIKEVKAGEGLGPTLSLFKKQKGHKKITIIDLVFFARNLSTALSAGVPLLRSLDIVSAQLESIKLIEILKEIGRDVKKGLSLSEAIGKYPRVFSSLWKGIIEVGETTGNLPFVLERLADYLEMRADFERKVKSTLIYPTMLGIAAFVAIFVFFKFILPQFTTLFEQFNIDLPLPTQILFNISNIINRYFFVIIGGVIALGIIFTQAKKRPAFKRFLDKFILNAPLIKNTVILTYLERFSSTMYILLESGIPIVYTLEVTAKSLGNSVLEEGISSMKDNVKKGKNLSSELTKISIFPPMVTEIAQIGEETGSMPEMFKRISTHYRKELSTRIERMVAMLEPLTILFMGIVIGGIVISLFLPLFKLATMGAK
jgi:type IV pilus assembly protein PilC